MIVLALALLGALTGAWVARRGGGNRLDMAQYAAVYGMIFVVLGLLAGIIVHRMLLA